MPEEEKYLRTWELEQEAEALSKFEREQHVSYTFDDCQANLKHLCIDIENKHRVNKLYTQLADLFTPIIKQVNKENHPKTTINKQKLLDIRDAFSRLIGGLPKQDG